MRVILDIGGTHMRVGIAEGSTPRDVRKAATPLASVDAFDTLVQLIERVTAGAKLDSIVGGIAGVVDEIGTVVNSPNLSGFEGCALGTRLTERFAVPVTLVNDVALAALGEAQYGAGRGSRIVAHVRVGTGVGGARVVDGVIDAHRWGFEPGHQIVDVVHKKTLESLIGGAALTRVHGAPPLQLPQEVYTEATPAFAVGVWNTIVCWSPDVVVLGGSLMNEPIGFRLALVRAEVEKLRQVVPELPEIRLGTLDDDAGLRGAIAYAQAKD